MNPGSFRESLPDNAAQRIGLVCGRFETAWRAGQKPRIEAYLGSIREPERSLLLRELVRLDAAYRQSQGEHPVADDYTPRFPQDLQTLQDAFRQGPRSGSGPNPSTPGNRTQSLQKSKGSKPIGETVPHEGNRESRSGSEPVRAVPTAVFWPSIPGYEVLEVLGEGGMGIVYRARELKLRRLVALKVMKPELAANATARQRFVREAQAMAAIEHHHVVAVFQVGEEGNLPYLAMELLRGETLRRRLEREGRLPLPEVLCIGREIAEGLTAAHEAGLVHRDIKPANVWLEDPAAPQASTSSAGPGRGTADTLLDQSRSTCVKILDFGLARAVTSQTQLSEPGSPIGTPQFMSPEQARGAEIDHRSDLFSLGGVLYLMAGGEVPFRGKTLGAVLKAVEEEQPADLRELNPELPADLANLVMRLLHKKPDRRPQSAQEVAKALEELEREHSAEPQPRPRRPRRRVLFATAAVLLLAIAGFVGYLIFARPFDAKEPGPTTAAPEEKVETKPPPTPPKIQNLNFNASGGNAEDRHRVDTGATEGTLILAYDMFGIPDRLTVYYEGGPPKLDTGLVSSKGTKVVKYGPGKSTIVEVVMNEGGSQGAGTAWTMSGIVIPRGVKGSVQSVNVTGGKGTFTLTFRNSTTFPLQHDARAVDVQSALHGLASIRGAGGSVSVTQVGTMYLVSFEGSLAEGPNPMILGTGSAGVLVTVGTLVK